MVSLKPYNTYQIDATAKTVYFPDNIQQVQRIVKKHPDIIVLGNGSNVILKQTHYDQRAFMIFSDNFADVKIQGNQIIAQAGVRLETLARLAYRHGLSGLETFYDIPASIGGAMIMNTGAYGDQIYNVVDMVTFYDCQRQCIETRANQQIHYGYRYSMFQQADYIVLEVQLQLVPANQACIYDKMAEIMAQRKARLPYDPSAGSVFKRPDYHISVGEMVQSLGLKGYRIGGAQISPKHGGVIINAGGATGQDILDLIDFMKHSVQKAYGVELSLEQVIIDEPNTTV